jgi:hypothetical protein
MSKGITMPLLFVPETNLSEYQQATFAVDGQVNVCSASSSEAARTIYHETATPAAICHDRRLLSGLGRSTFVQPEVVGKGRLLPNFLETLSGIGEQLGLSFDATQPVEVIELAPRLGAETTSRTRTTLDLSNTALLGLTGTVWLNTAVGGHSLVEPGIVTITGNVGPESGASIAGDPDQLSSLLVVRGTSLSTEVENTPLQAVI